MNKDEINKCSFVYLSIVLIILTLSVYWQVKNFDFINYDDDVFVTQNNHVTTGLNKANIKWAFLSDYEGNWMPLTWISFMLDSQLRGLNPAYFHLVNLTLHLLNTILLFLIFCRMTGALWKSAVIAALFAIHPLHVESVAWIAERKDVLSTFFMMLTILVYINYARKPDYKKYALLFVLFACGLMSKPMLVTLPFVLLLLDYWPLQRFSIADLKIFPEKRKEFIRLIYEKIPLLVLTVISVILTIIAQKHEISIHQIIPFYLRIENALVVYYSYIIKMVWPGSLAVLYPHPAYLPIWQILSAALVLISISVLAIYYIKRFPYIIVGWLWFLGTLIPVIGLVQVGVQSMADRYTYIPLTGLFIIIVFAASDIAEKFPYRKLVLTSISLIVIISLTIVTWSQLKYWQNSSALFTRALAVTENNYVMLCNMGVLSARQGNSKDAANYYGEAIKIKPDDPDTNYNYGNLLVMQGNYNEAIGCYNITRKNKPDFAAVYNNLGISYAQLAHQEKAIEHFREAVRLNPEYIEARNNLAFALASRKKIKESQLIADTGKNNKIDTARGQIQAGMLLLKKGDLEAATSHFREALKLEPLNFNAHVSIGLALGYQQKFDESIIHFRKAIAINSKIPEIYNSLAVALTYTGKIDEAIVQLKKAIEINPGFAKAYNSLGVILAKTGKVDYGISYLQEAVRLDPDNAEAKKNLDLVLSMKGNR